MAEMNFSGLDFLDFEKILEIPDAVKSEMLKAGAEKIADKQREKARTMLAGPYYSGTTANAVTVGAFKTDKSGGHVDVEFKGSRSRKGKAENLRNAKIAYLNERGVKNKQPARPFISTANNESAKEATEAAKAVYEKWLNSQL